MIDRETFLKPALPERTVTVTAGDVTVRGLSRAEVMGLAVHKSDLAALEQAILRLGLVDPALDAADVEAWYGAAPAGDVDLVVDVISDLSGMSEGAQKSGVLGVRE